MRSPQLAPVPPQLAPMQLLHFEFWSCRFVLPSILRCSGGNWQFRVGACNTPESQYRHLSAWGFVSKRTPWTVVLVLVLSLVLIVAAAACCLLADRPPGVPLMSSCQAGLPAAPPSSDLMVLDRVIWDFAEDELRVKVVPEVVPAVRLRPLLDPVPARVTVWGTNPPVIDDVRHAWVCGLVRREASLVQSHGLPVRQLCQRSPFLPIHFGNVPDAAHVLIRDESTFPRVLAFPTGCWLPMFGHPTSDLA